MQKTHTSFITELYPSGLFASLSIVITTLTLVFIGRDVLGEAVIALIYLIPVGWSAARWGKIPGICAAITAALAFDYFFIPPFYTFTVGSLEGWLVLAIFLVVAIIVVGRIQSGLSRAQTSEREAIFMYELSTTLAGLNTQPAVMHALANHLQVMFHAALVEVFVQPMDQSAPLIIAAPSNGVGTGKPDCILPLLASPGMVGEIRLWRGQGWLPPQDSRLFRNLAVQAVLALERAYLAEAELRARNLRNLNLESS